MTRTRIGLVVALLLAAAVVVALVVRPDDPVPSASPSPSAAAPAGPAAQPVAGADGIGDPYFPLAGNGGYDVLGYDVDVRYDPATDRLDGRTTITATATQDLASLNLDLRLAATAAQVDGAPAQVAQNGGELRVTPATPLRAGAPATVTIEYGGVPSEVRAESVALDPWTRTPDGAVAVGQPDSAAWWYPSNDHPSDKATVAVTATVPDGVEALSNGALLAGPEDAGPGLDRWRWRADEPMATYLAFLAVGQYELVRRDTPAGPYLAAYAEGLDPRVGATARAAVERTPEVVAVLADVLGPYPFGQLGGVVPDADLGFALETQTRPVYSPAFFDGDDGTAVVVHELAHQWFGDLVAVQRWRDIWLNEGFATYFEWLYAERTGGPPAARTARSYYQRIAPDSRLWTSPPGDPGAQDVLGQAVYVRGGMAVQAVREAVGDEDFFALLRTWVTERAGGNATVEQFLETAERVSGEDLDEVAREWLYDADRPPPLP